MGPERFSTLWAVIAATTATVLVGATFLGAASASLAFPSEAPFPGGLVYWEPTVATDPSSAYVYQAVTVLNGSANPSTCPGCMGTSPHAARIFVRASPDGGATWGVAAPVCACGGQGWQFDPQLAVSDNGTVYAAFLQTFDPGAVLYESYDHGTSWLGPVEVAPAFHYSDKPLLLVSPDGRDVYVAFRGKADGFVAASHNGGVSFLAPVRTTTVPTSWSGPYAGTIAPNGAVYFAEMWELPSGAEEITVLRSADRGATWVDTVLDTSLTPPPCGVTRAITCYYPFLEAHETIASDPAGALLLVYTANAANGTAEDLYSTASTDGVTWSPRTLVNAQGDNFAPQLASGPVKGDFRLAWQDDRNAPCWNCGALGGWNTWYEATKDGGRTWSLPVRLSNLPSGAPYKGPSGFLWPDGDYFGLAVGAQGTSYVLWGEDDAASLYCCGGAWYTQGPGASS